jgi:type III restriction enzyme
MQLVFESNLEYQQQACKTVTDVFLGQMYNSNYFELSTQGSNIVYSPNRLNLSDEQILANMQMIQKNNNLSVTDKLDGILSFAIEMETGTGKTYVYLRTIFELNKLYGYTKFVIVVPSVAILEGVLSNLRLTEEHFKTIYEANSSYGVYNSSKISNLRQFATSNNIEILVINIDSFAKDDNIINRANDKLCGNKPIEYIQGTKPIVIIDEPQNMETDKRKQAIKSLNPLVIFRYSATHRDISNLLYKLDPVKAFELNLVKQIEVYSVVEEDSFNDAYIEVVEIKSNSKTFWAKIKLNYCDKQGVNHRVVKANIGDDLYELSNHNELYRDEYKINSITQEQIKLSNSKIYPLKVKEHLKHDDTIKAQIKATIKAHLDRELSLYSQGIKVLSLFFIDKVANYRSYDDNGNAVMGKIAIMFEEIYNECIKAHKYAKLTEYFPQLTSTIHNGYFSTDKKGRDKDTRGDSVSDADTYNLIMKDKERLLALDNPLRFIFSHSALREGWDNPNVFQICTINYTNSEIKKRQEIGRGLRLCVNQDGSRVRDKNINVLTIVANESYDSFAKALQTEIETDCGVRFNQKIVANAKHRITIPPYKNLLDERFLAIWNKIKYKTRYRVEFDNVKFIEAVSTKIGLELDVKSPIITVNKATMQITQNGVEAQNNGVLSVDMVSNRNWQIGNVLTAIENKTSLTRNTIYQILHKSNKIKDIHKNPQAFVDGVSDMIKTELEKLMIDGIKYEKLADEVYQMELFDIQELSIYIDNTYQVRFQDKTIHNEYISLDSDTENKFAKDCENNSDVKFYFKLPRRFKIPTPIGNYNPDWALVLGEDDGRVYFVVETKNTWSGNQIEEDKLRDAERLKIKCGRAHFEELSPVKYEVEVALDNVIKKHYSS